MFRRNSKHKDAGMFQKEVWKVSDRLTRFAKHWSTKYYHDIFCHINEDEFKDMYCDDNGRPNSAVNILVSFDILKNLFRHTDAVAYDRIQNDEGFRNACGITDPAEIFSIRTLYNFRGALAEYELKEKKNPVHTVFANGRDKIIEELGLKTGMQRIDSVMIAANIKRMSRLTLFHKVLSNLCKQITGLDLPVPDTIMTMIRDDEDGFAYRLADDEIGSTTKTIAHKIVELTETYKHHPLLPAAPAYKNAVRLLEEQCNLTRHLHNVELQLKDNADISSGSMQNPADPDATYRKKKGEEHQGYAATAAETCDPENAVQVITEVIVVKNNVDDSTVLTQNLAKLKEETGLECAIADGGFVTQNAHNAAAKIGVELFATGIRGRQSETKDLNTRHFSFQEDGMIESCPAGNAPIKQHLIPGESLTASFDRRTCSGCPLNERCLAYQSENSCRLVVTPGRLKLDAFRANSADEIRLRNLRPPVEGTMSDIKPRYLSGRILFRGIERVHAQLLYRAISINFKRKYGKKWLSGPFEGIRGSKNGPVERNILKQSAITCQPLAAAA